MSGRSGSAEEARTGLLSPNSINGVEPESSLFRGRVKRVYDYLFGTEKSTSITTFAFVLILGLILGFAVPDDSDAPTDLSPVAKGAFVYCSSIIGWIYFTAWSVSFYPQIFLNYQRKSVVGLSFEYQALNLLGFSCYTAYNAGYYWNPTVRQEYEQANGKEPGFVQINDVFFAVHAVVLTAVVLFQIWYYPKGGQRIHPIIVGALIVMTASIFIVLIIVATGKTSWNWTNFLSYLSYIKLAITLMKYTPQAYLNYKRKSTTGWTIHNVLLDFTGGLLSVVQVILDGAVTGNYSQYIGDPVKFVLGFTSIVFDIIFMFQHYVLYKHATDDAARNANAVVKQASSESVPLNSEA